MMHKWPFVPFIKISCKSGFFFCTSENSGCFTNCANSQQWDNCNSYSSCKFEKCQHSVLYYLILQVLGHFITFLSHSHHWGMCEIQSWGSSQRSTYKTEQLKLLIKSILLQNWKHIVIANFSLQTIFSVVL